MTTKKVKKSARSKTSANPKPRSEARPNRLSDLRMRGVVLSQESVAAIVGLDITTVNAHENGRRAITQEVARKYALLYTGGEVVLLFNPPAQLETLTMRGRSGDSIIVHHVKKSPNVPEE